MKLSEEEFVNWTKKEIEHLKRRVKTLEFYKKPDPKEGDPVTEEHLEYWRNEGKRCILGEVEPTPTGAGLIILNLIQEIRRLQKKLENAGIEIYE